MSASEVPRHMDREVYSKVVVTKPVDYVEKYHAFLSTTDEKDVLAGALGSLLREGSVLDIGAGTGDIPDSMQLDPKRYTAIEQRPEFITALKTKGYSVVEDLFPCPTPTVYNNVLMSYVLYGREQCEVMIDPAWDLVAPRGQLLAVTYRDNVDDYTKLLHKVGHTRRVNTDIRFNYLRDKFSSLGKTAIHTARSHIYSPDLEGIASAVSFMATNTPVGTPEKRAEIHGNIIAEREYLDEHYKVNDGSYKFPVDHYIFAVEK